MNCIKAIIMSKHATLIYPHQLYTNHPAINHSHQHYVIEDTLFFGDLRYPLNFHKQKLLYHRATMKRYVDDVLDGYDVVYLEYAQTKSRLDFSFYTLAQVGITDVHVVDVTDDVLDRRIRRYCKKYNLTLHVYDSPNFLVTRDDIDTFWHHRRADDYRQTDFYIWMRKRLGLYITDEGKPIGGKWTYDTDNRKKLKKDVIVPQVTQHMSNPYIDEARHYVEEHFASNPGQMQTFVYATNHDEALTVLHQFLHERLNDYGTYQDAITQRTPFLFHSMLSAPLNIGLLSPQDIINALIDYHQAHPDLRFGSIEGFLRQVIGWREFMRAVYLREGVRQRNSNFFHSQNQLNQAWYNAKVGMPVVDEVIEKINQYAYAHHIERLMILGNLMLLCQVHPTAVYNWFMEMFIDAYDWVMVPNVYGMSQYADGGLITTKPYISSSNYILKMSSYKKGDWSTEWTSLYWTFIQKHREFFSQNARLSMMTSHLRRMDETTIQAHIASAEKTIARLTQQ